MKFRLRESRRAVPKLGARAWQGFQRIIAVFIALFVRSSLFISYSANGTHDIDLLYWCFFVSSQVIKCSNWITTVDCAGRILVLLLVSFKVSSSEIVWLAFTYLSHIACLCSLADRRRYPAWHTIRHSDTTACTQLQHNTACLKFRVQTLQVNSCP